MARSERGFRVKRRLQGVAFLVVVAALLGLTIAVYNKVLPWQASDRVTLEAARVGDQLVVPADVKLNGVLVGRVSGVSTDGDSARMTLQIDKSRIHDIPANVVARILPKTLFGEKFVELVVPPGGPHGTLQPGATIPQDRSKTAIELQTVFNDLVPLLRAVKPDQLAVTLSNLATALRGRGDALGHNLELVDTYFSRFNKDLPNFEHDISALADVSGGYADAAPDLLRVLHNLSVNARTITQKQDVYANFLAGTSDFAQTATTVFGDNADRLIRLANVSAPVTHLYANFSKVLECLPNGLAIYDRTRLEQTFEQGRFLHITLTPVGNRGAYQPQDKPKKSDLSNPTLPPNCFGLPYGNHDLHPVNSRYPGNHPSDNYACAGFTAPQSCPSSSQSPAAQPAATRKRAKQQHGVKTPQLPSVDTGGGSVGSQQEQDFIQQLLDPLVGGGGSSSAGLQDLLMGPMLRGMAVSIS